MQKFFSLVCATLLVFSVSAAPVAQKAQLVKKAPVAVEQMQKVQFEQAQIANFNQLSAAPALKVINQEAKAKIGPKELAAQSRSVAPKKQAQDYTSTLSYKCGPTEVVVTDLSTPTYNEFKLVITQKAKNTAEYSKETLYDNTVELIIDPDEHSIVGTFTTDDYTISSNTFLKSGSNTRYVSYWENSTITIVSKGGNKYAITDGLLQVENTKGTTLYKYDYCYAAADLNDQAAEKTAFEFTFGEEPTPPQPSYDTIPVTVAAYQEKYYASSLDWQAILVDAAGNGYIFDIFAPAEGFENGKTYTSDNGDFDLEYTFASVNKVNDSAVKASFTKTETEDALTVTAEMTTAANHVYQITYTEKVIQWTEWAKFAPLGKSTGTWTFGAVSSFSGATCVSNIYVREDKDNSAKQQIKVEGWGAQVLTASGVDLIIDWDTITNVCTIAEQSTGAYQSAYQEYTMISDLNTYTGKTDYPSSYDPATGKFSLAVVYYISAGQFGYGTETLQMKSSEIKPLDYDATDADFSADFSNDDTKIAITGTTATVGATDADLKTLSLEMYVTSGSTQIPAGDYTITDSKEVGTALASEGVSGGYVTASFAGNRNTSGQITTPMWFLVEGNVNVAYNDYIMTLTVAAKNSNGKNINITVTKDYTPVVERDTVDIVSTALKYNDLIASNKVVIYYAADVPNYYLFRVTSNNATSVDGTFKWSDGTINDPNSYFSVSGTDKNYFQDGEFTVVTNNKDIVLTGWMIGVDEKYYRLNMSYTAPTERDTVRFSGQGVTISECINSQTGVQTGWLYNVTDASTGYRFTLQSTVVANKYGTFSYEDKTLGNNYYNVFDPQGNRQQFVEGSITVGEVGDSLILDGVLVAQDDKAYVLHFAQSAKVLNYDTDAPFDATFAWSDMKASISNGVISISLQKGTEIAMELELYADPAATTIPEGTYTISDSKEASTALQSTGYGEQGPAACYAATLVVQQSKLYLDDMWFLVEGTITLSYDEYGKLKVVVDGKNSYGQPVTALVQYEKLEPKSEVTIEADNLTFNGAGTAFMLDAANADYEVVLAVMSTDTAGTYGVEDLVAAYSAIYSAAGQVSILDGEFTLAVDGKNMTLTGSLLASDTIQYNLNITGYMGALRLDQDEDVTMSFNLDDATMSGRSGVTTISIQNANQEVVALQVVAQLDGEKLPEGEYLINDTKESNTVIASTGVDPTTGKVAPSYVGLIEGTSLGKVWFLRSGKMTVDAKGNMTINAKNSLDRDVVVTIVVSPTDLINANDNSKFLIQNSKLIKNGRLMIIKDAKVYSVLGQQIQ